MYYVINIVKMARHRNEKEYSVYDEEEIKFSDLHETREFLVEQYAGKKSRPLYIDTRRGDEKVGYMYGFTFEPSSYGETSGFEQHLVQVKQVEAKPVLVRV